MTAPEARLHSVIEAGDSLGEGILWDDSTQSLWWTDIHGCRLHCHDWATRTDRVFTTPERLGSFALTTRAGTLLAAFESGIALYVPQTQSLQWLTRPLQQGDGLRFNDGRTDRSGRFWVASMREGAGAADAALHSFDLAQGLRTHVHGLAIGNGICFSPDGRRAYWADSSRTTIHHARFDAASGTLDDAQVFARTEDAIEPDGANVDSAGRVWGAQWGGSRVVCYAPDGSIAYRLTVPVSQPTCVAFGGPDMNLLFVTSARVGLDAAQRALEPLAGHVLVYTTSVTGIADARFVLETT